jgi:hypothetical protein
MPEYANKYKPKELYYRYKKCKCEMCKAENVDVKIYQVKALNELTRGTEWENLMLDRNRKTLVVCNACYEKINKK